MVSHGITGGKRVMKGDRSNKLALRGQACALAMQQVAQCNLPLVRVTARLPDRANAGTPTMSA